MRMNTVAKVALYLVSVLVFNVIYFNVISGHTPARWVSYAAIHFSYLLLCVSSLSFRQDGAGGSVVHVYLKMMVANGYFIVSLLCGAILILINNSTIAFPVIVHALIIGFYIFHYLLLMNAETHTEANAQRNKRDAFFGKDCTGRLELAMQRVPTRELRRTVERFRDAVFGSSMRTLPQVSELEEQIRARVLRVEDAIGSGELDKVEKAVQEGVDLVRERERQIALCR